MVDIEERCRLAAGSFSGAGVGARLLGRDERRTRVMAAFVVATCALGAPLLGTPLKVVVAALLLLLVVLVVVNHVAVRVVRDSGRANELSAKGQLDEAAALQHELLGRWLA